MCGLTMMANMNYSTLAVMGTFDETGGKFSGFAEKIWRSIRDNINGPSIRINGGNYKALQMAYETALKTDVVIWWANVPNDAPISKLVGDIKKDNPTTLLVISKNNLDNKYEWVDLVGRLLSAHASLGVVFQRSGEKFVGTVLDPLGNAFSFQESDPTIIGETIAKRIVELKGFSRMRSKSIGPVRDIPDVSNFCEIIKAHAEKFHDLVHSANPSRFVGNASFRCTNGGFPAFRATDRIFVSRRNVDKRELASDAFVEIVPEISNTLEYYGEVPPSVDAPIQRALFKELPDVNFMLHAHVYITDAPFTSHRVPCGALEEVDEILGHKAHILGELNAHGKSFINLKGHGCIAFSTTCEALQSISWKARDLPEKY